MLQVPCVCVDSGRHSCIVTQATLEVVKFIDMNSTLLEVKSSSYVTFVSRYRPTDYDIPKAAAHYLNAAKNITCAPATKDLLKKLAAGLKPAYVTFGDAQAAYYTDFNGEPTSPVLGSSDPDSGNEDHDMAAKKVTPAKKAAPAKKVAPVEKKTSGRKPGTGALVTEMLLAGKDNATILEKVRAQFPDSAANASTVSWYRSKLKKEGQLK